MKPKVSIILPAYNCQAFIGECLRSVLNQTFRDWEMVIVDDASSDGTGEIIKSFDDPRLKYTRHRQNYGFTRMAETHNEALALAQGEMITILESDDYWPLDRLASQIPVFNEREVVLCHGLIMFDKDGKHTLCDNPLRIPSGVLQNVPVGTALKVFLSGYNFILAQSVMVRADALRKIGGFRQFPTLYEVDYPTWMELTLLGEFVFMPKVLGYWRRHGTSITSVHYEKLWLGSIECAKTFSHVFEKRIKDLSAGLDAYVENPGGYGYCVLYKLYLLNGKKQSAESLLREIWRSRKTLFLTDLIKVLLLIPLLWVSFLRRLYKQYLEIRTREFSPF